MSAPTILRRATDAVMADPPIGDNGVKFAEMSLDHARACAAALALQLDIYRRAWRVAAPQIGRGYGQLGQPTEGREPKPHHEEIG